MNTKKQLKVFIDGYLLNKEPQGVTTYVKEIYKEAALLNPNNLFYIGCFENKIIKKNLENFRSDPEIYSKIFNNQYPYIDPKGDYKI